MRTYITCAKRKGSPKVPVEACLTTCKHRKKCPVFYRLQNPTLFPEQKQPSLSETR